MDKLDVAIMKEMANRLVLWGGLDPRLSPSRIAKAVGVDRTTVRARLSAWKDEGFLQSLWVLPNPGLLGLRYAVTALRLTDDRMKPEVLDALDNVEGVIVRMEYVGPWIGVGQAFDDLNTLHRRLRLLERLPGIAEVQPPFFMDHPAATVIPSALDWRIMHVLSTLGVEKFSRVASELEISTRTLTRRYDRLVQGNALWNVPCVDFTVPRAATMTKLIIGIRPGSDAIGLGAALAKRFPHMHSFTYPGPLGPAFFELWGPFATPGAADDAKREVESWPTVAAADCRFPVRFNTNGQWIVERLAQRALGARQPIAATGKNVA